MKKDFNPNAPTLLIEMEGGVIQYTCATRDINLIIVDHDMKDYREIDLIERLEEISTYRTASPDGHLSLASLKRYVDQITAKYKKRLEEQKHGI